MEHRLYKRYPLELILTVCRAGKKCSAARSVSVGAGGLSIENPTPSLSMGQVVTLDLSRNVGLENFHSVKAMVIHLTGSMVGVMFEQQLPSDSLAESRFRYQDQLSSQAVCGK